VKIVLTGGFLGSGKTTAILEASSLLSEQGIKVAVITNDQGNQQVDSRYLATHPFPVAEVADACFCCKFEELDQHIHTLLLDRQVEVIFAESVGSCTDLAATVVNPLLHFHDKRLDIVLSVFADIRLLGFFLQGNKDIFYGNVNYIFQKQLEEADLIIVNKIDLLTPDQLALAKALIEKEFRGKTILYQNSLSGDSVRDWIDLVLYHWSNPEFRQSLELDYDLYAKGEAELAWLDEVMEIEAPGKNAGQAALVLIEQVYSSILRGKYPIGHLKFLLDDGQSQNKISFTFMESGDLNPIARVRPTSQAKLLINARVQTEPYRLREILSHAIDQVQELMQCRILRSKGSAFKPGYPKPTHRIQQA
jgi:G3E family GTPase